MSRATLYVRFPDGEIRYGIYDNHADSAVGQLHDAPGLAWDAQGDEGDTLPPATPEPGVPVDIATDYADGSTWRGTATRNTLTAGFDLTDESLEATDGLPPWVV